MVRKLKFLTALIMVATLVLNLSALFVMAKEVPLYGDVDMNGKITVRDVSVVQKHCARKRLMSDEQLAVADVDNSGRVNVLDATCIQKKVANIIDKFPIEGGKMPEDTKPETTVPEINRTVTKATPQEIEKEFFRLVNKERTSKGLKELSYNQHLEDVTEIRCKEITTYFSHTRPNGEKWHTLISDDKYYYRSVGENIGGFYHYVDNSATVGKTFVASKEQIKSAGLAAFTAFKESPKHYANMMREDFRDTGIGISYVWNEKDVRPCFYMAHIFGVKM